MLPKRSLSILFDFPNYQDKIAINGIKSNLKIGKMGFEDGLKSGFKDLINYSSSIELRYTENTCKIVNIQISRCNHRTR